MTSDARVKCVPNTMIIGVGCGKSYSISNPTRIFIRNAFPLAFGNGDEAIEYKAPTALFGRWVPLAQKAMAIRPERAHGGQCSKMSTASCEDELVDRHDHTIATGNGSLQAFLPDQGRRSAAAARPL